MNPTTAWVLIGSSAALVVAGTTMLWASSALAKRHRPRAARPLAGPAGALTCTSVVCGVITGAQWAVLSQTGPGAAWLAVLWLPAFLAAATVVRLLALVRVVLGRRGRARAIRRGRGCHR
jgi:hypothetical protein